MTGSVCIVDLEVRIGKLSGKFWGRWGIRVHTHKCVLVESKAAGSLAGHGQHLACPLLPFPQL